MSELRQRETALRSEALRDSANGAPCMLEFPCCNHDAATSVWAHYHDETFGRARKAHDTSGFPACSACHAFLDVGWPGKMDLGLLRFYVIRALQRTFVWLIETGVVTVKLDKQTPAHDRPTRKRKPPEQRRKVLPSRKLQSRNDLKREARP